MKKPMGYYHFRKTGSEAAPDKLSGVIPKKRKNSNWRWDQDMPAGETGERMIGSIPGQDMIDMGTKLLFHQAWVPQRVHGEEKTY